MQKELTLKDLFELSDKTILSGYSYHRMIVDLFLDIGVEVKNDEHEVSLWDTLHTMHTAKEAIQILSDAILVLNSERKQVIKIADKLDSTVLYGKAEKLSETMVRYSTTIAELSKLPEDYSELVVPDSRIDFKDGVRELTNILESYKVPNFKGLFSNL